MRFESSLVTKTKLTSLIRATIDNINVTNKYNTMKTRLTLYQRLKPEYKQLLKKDFADRPFSHTCIVETLSTEFFFTEVKYGIVHDVMDACNLAFFGDAFNPNPDE